MWPFIPGERFPYANFHSMNQDWIIKVVKEFQDQYENIQQLIRDTTGEGLEELEAKKTELEALLQQWYNTHSSDIATQLANALNDIQSYAASVIASIPQEYSAMAYRVQDTINFNSFDLVSTESGTYNDADGNTKTENNARRRNRSPVPVEPLAYINIPAGYEIYTYCLDGYYTKHSVISWTSGQLNCKNLPNNTKYINFAIRKISDPSDDISTENLIMRLIKIGYNILARWNIDEQGIFIDGNAIVITENGFSIEYNNNEYTIAPVDTTTITRFTANVGDIKTLVIKPASLVSGSRNEPSEVIEILDGISYTASNEKYITVATYYKYNWEFMDAFTYFNQIGKITLEPDYVAWNNKAGGIYKSQNDIIVNEDGFCFTFNGHSYYIAPRDLQTITTFTPQHLTGTYALVADPAKLIYPGERNNPSDVLSIISFRGSAYSKRYITIAIYYKGVWSFNGKFAFFERKNIVPVNNIFNEQHIIAHKGGNTATDNTIANYEAAIAAGYKFVETDAQITSDNIIVLHHDTSFTIAGNSYTFANLTYSQVKALLPNIATLKELLTLCKRNNIVIDLDCSKGTSINYITTIYNTVKNAGCLSRVMFTTFVQNAKQLINNGKCIICLSEIDTENELKTIYDIVENTALCICSLQGTNYTADIIELIHSYGCLTKVWTINNATTINNMFNNNVDMIISDSIKESDL